MPFTLIMFVIFAIITVLTYWGGKASQKGSDPFPPAVAWLPGIIAFLFIAWACLAFVPTRSIGVVTSFGKPVSTLSNGVHIKAPWQKVHDLDGTIQTNSRTGSNEHPTGTDKAACTDVRIGNGSEACVDNSVRWRIKLSAGQSLYRDYPKGMDAITDSLVRRQLTGALNDVLGSYNPLAQIEDLSGTGAGSPNLSKLSQQVEDALNARISSDIEIEDVILPIIRFDKNTQAKINAYQAEVANTRIAEQSEQTAKAQARANDNLKQSVSNNPNVLVARCLDTLGEMVKDKQRVPVGFTCWPGGNGPVIAQVK